MLVQPLDTTPDQKQEIVAQRIGSTTCIDITQLESDLVNAFKDISKDPVVLIINAHGAADGSIQTPQGLSIFFSKRRGFCQIFLILHQRRRNADWQGIP